MPRVSHLFLLFAIALLTPALALADPPSRPLRSFRVAEKVARDVIYASHHVDFYCGRAWTLNNTGTSGKIDPSSCGCRPRKNKARCARLEWEHVVPAAFFGQSCVCWRKRNSKCVRSNGKSYKGHPCCEHVDIEFNHIEADLHNLTPAVGELNGDRSNTHYGVVPGEPRLYGACDFEVGRHPKVTEPPDNVRGETARIWLYMSDTYGIKLMAAQRKMFEKWSKGDPVDS